MEAQKRRAGPVVLLAGVSSHAVWRSGEPSPVEKVGEWMDRRSLSGPFSQPHSGPAPPTEPHDGARAALRV